MSIELILADDHAMVREGLKLVIESKGRDIKVIGEASNGREVLNMAMKKPDVVYILDISMPVLNGIETARRLKKMDAKSKIIILSIHDTKNFVEQALQCGVKGYVLKEDASEELVYAIRTVHMGRFFLSGKISKYVIDGFLTKRLHDRKEVVKLTGKEREILQLIAEGLTSKEIATRLNLSLNTAHAHRNNIMQKLDLHKQTDLVRYAIKEGITPL